MITAGGARGAPPTVRLRRRLPRRRTGGRVAAATGGATPVAAWPAPPAGGSCLVMACFLLPRAGSGALVGQRRGGLLTGRLGLLDVPGEHGLVDHLDPGTVVVVEDRVLNHAVGRLALS